MLIVLSRQPISVSSFLSAHQSAKLCQLISVSISLPAYICQLELQTSACTPSIRLQARLWLISTFSPYTYLCRLAAYCPWSRDSMPGLRLSLNEEEIILVVQFPRK